MKKITVIGHFAFGLQYLDGQTVKTKILTEELCRRFGEEKVARIDTHGGIKTLLKAPFQLFSALRKSENIIILPAHNGLRINAPLLSFGKRLFKSRKLHYIVIGGWLPEFLKKRRFLLWTLKSFDGIYVETNGMKKKIEEQGLSNIFVMPNCKELSILSEEQLVWHTKAPYPLCTFSRVTPEKGIEDAIQAVQSINAQAGQVIYTLDIYGQVDIAYQQRFQEIQKAFPQYIRYRGAVPYDRSVEVLKDYFALLFPTYYQGEGFAGTLIDAMAASLPGIASDWRYNAEIVEDGKTGRVHPAHNQEALREILFLISQHPEQWNSMKTVCLEKAKAYLPGNAIQILLDRI